MNKTDPLLTCSTQTHQKDHHLSFTSIRAQPISPLIRTTPSLRLQLLQKDLHRKTQLPSLSQSHHRHRRPPACLRTTVTRQEGYQISYQPPSRHQTQSIPICLKDHQLLLRFHTHPPPLKFKIVFSQFSHCTRPC